MIKKKYAIWRTVKPGHPFDGVDAECWQKVRRVTYDDILAEEIPAGAARMDENYANPDADVRILAWMTDDGTLHYWTDADAIQLTNESRRAFSDLYFAEEIDLSRIDTSRMTDMSYMFSNDNSLKAIDLSGFDTSGARKMCSMFAGCRSLESIDLSPLDTSGVKDFPHMFDRCESLKSLDVTPLDTHSAENMSGMFEVCTSLKSLDLSSFDTSNLKYADYMFFFDTSLKSLDMSGFDTKNVLTMDHMFDSCRKLRTVTVSDGWDKSIRHTGTKFKKKNDKRRQFCRNR